MMPTYRISGILRRQNHYAELPNHYDLFTASLYDGGDVGVEYVLYEEYGGASGEYVDVVFVNCPG